MSEESYLPSWLNSSAVERKVLFKKLKLNSSGQNPGHGKQSQAILILAILSGTSLVLFCLWQGNLSNFSKNFPTKDLDMNLHSFTYEDLEEATGGFKEELGKGSFGIVYKGVLASSHDKYVAVKKLDKMLREDEREFQTEVNVIGQTHHKNLVQLLGYCDKSED